MRAALKQAVQMRYDFRCGYCGMRETDASSELTIDHYLPVSQGGTDDLDNLVYCCHPCNEFKSKYWHIDPKLSLLYPPFDDVTQHFQEQPDGTLLALTERGENHIQVLHLNRLRLVELCLERQDFAFLRAHYQANETRMTHVEEAIRRIENQLKKLFGDPDA